MNALKEKDILSFSFTGRNIASQNRCQAKLEDGVTFIISNIAIDKCLKATFFFFKLRKKVAFILCLRGQIGYNLISKREVL